MHNLANFKPPKLRPTRQVAANRVQKCFSFAPVRQVATSGQLAAFREGNKLFLPSLCLFLGEILFIFYLFYAQKIQLVIKSQLLDIRESVLAYDLITFVVGRDFVGRLLFGKREFGRNFGL